MEIETNNENIVKLIDASINVAKYIEVAEVDWPDVGKQRVMAVDDLQYLPTVDPIHAAGGRYCKECEYHRWEQEGTHGKTVCFCNKFQSQVAKDFFCDVGKIRKEK